MIPKDKFGRPIYPGVFTVLKRNGDVLLQCGYKESVRKPNLFFLALPEGILFVNMQGTMDIPVWEDTRPALHWKFDDGVPMWKRRRIIKQELLRLHNAGCACRFFFFMYDTKEFDNVWLTVDDGNGVLECSVGFCLQCGKDFQGDGETCSDECDTNYRDSFKRVCVACGLKMEYSEEVRHHTSYFPESIILVHRSCHTRIHHTHDFPALRPTDGEAAKFYAPNRQKGIGPLDDYP